ncbi:MAG: hypothetical protein WC916_06290 [Candidatus Woesearchaeota archaeon]
MFIWLFALGDLLSMLAMINMHYDIIPGWRFPFVSILYLVMKGILFFGDALTFIDLFFAVYMILMLVFNVHWFLTYIGIVYFVYKIIVGFFSSH